MRFLEALMRAQLWNFRSCSDVYTTLRHYAQL